MLLTQPRPLHSSICTAVLSLLPPAPPCSFSQSVRHLTHTHTERERGGGRKERNTHAHTHIPAFIVISVLLHHDTPNHINRSNNLIRALLKHEQRQCYLGFSQAYCVVVSKTDCRFLLLLCPIPSCVAFKHFLCHVCNVNKQFLVIISKKHKQNHHF